MGVSPQDHAVEDAVFREFLFKQRRRGDTVLDRQDNGALIDERAHVFYDRIHAVRLGCEYEQVDMHSLRRVRIHLRIKDFVIDRNTFCGETFRPLARREKVHVFRISLIHLIHQGAAYRACAENAYSFDHFMLLFIQTKCLISAISITDIGRINP